MLLMFWSLNIVICNLFVIWCLIFGILLAYPSFLCNWFKIYFDVPWVINALLNTNCAVV
jgi:hypothetical protein